MSIWRLFFLIKFLEWTDVAVLGLLFIVFSLIFSILEFLFLDNSLSSNEGKFLLKALTGVFWFLNELKPFPVIICFNSLSFLLWYWIGNSVPLWFVFLRSISLNENNLSLFSGKLIVIFLLNFFDEIFIKVEHYISLIGRLDNIITLLSSFLNYYNSNNSSNLKLIKDFVIENKNHQFFSKMKMNSNQLPSTIFYKYNVIWIFL